MVAVDCISKMDPLQCCLLVLCFFLVAIPRSVADVQHPPILDLKSTDLVSAGCHQHAAMVCNIDSQQEPSITYFAWISPDGTELCKLDSHGDDVIIHHHDNAAVNCTYRDKELVLLLRHVKPAQQGAYHCKLRSSLGVKSDVTHLKLQECYHSLHPHSHGGNVTCRAHGVYPEGLRIHWFQGPHGDQNITHLAVAQPSSQAADGTYEVASTLLQHHHHHPTATADLKCALWSPVSMRYLTETEIRPPRRAVVTHAASSRARSKGTTPLGTAARPAVMLLLTTVALSLL
ncbi:uncharacterized protein LOC134453525 [Engraulis encrasicolus]|uniref:uncharacterized protein LOC134453525 n=1 Tax=Engraulis encrasicolus TaxID=184585 RepID=UPI002FD28E68